MSLADELERLRTLHISGALSDDEYDRAKARLLDAEAGAEPGHAEPAGAARGGDRSGGEDRPQPGGGEPAGIDWTDVAEGPPVGTGRARAGGAEGGLGGCLRLAWAICALAAVLSLVGYKIDPLRNSGRLAIRRA